MCSSGMFDEMMVQLFAEESASTTALEVPFAAQGIGFLQVGLVVNQAPGAT